MVCVQTIGLRENSIGAEGCTALADAMDKLTALVNLDLGFSRIGRKGCMALIARLRWMTALEKLKFDGNSIGKDAMDQLKGTVPHKCQVSVDNSSGAAPVR